MIVSLVMLAIMAGCAVLLYLKGTLIQGVSMIFNALLAGIIALAFYEMLSRFLIQYASGVAVWAHMICFLLLLILVFAILQAAFMQFAKEKGNLGQPAEQVGRIVCGIVLGYIVTGELLLAAAVAPLPAQYPYRRFDPRNPNPSQPNKPLLNPDGFAAGLFGIISKGSLSAMGRPQSFAVLQANYLDQLYLNRHQSGVPTRTSQPAIEVPRQNGVWYAPSGLRDSEGSTVSPGAGERLMLVRVGIKKSALKDAGKFTLSQLRLVCGPKRDPERPLAGAGQVVYPMGYMGANGRLERKSLGEIITIQSSDVPGNARTIDLAFSLPSSQTPLLIAFKQNNLAQVSAIAAAEEAPQPIPFGASAPAPQERPRPGSPASAPPERPGDRPRNGSGLSDVSRSIVGPLGEN